jgi:hypothetical protein
MKCKKITVTFSFENGDTIKQVLSEKTYPWAEMGPDELLKKSVDCVDSFKKEVKTELCIEQLEVPMGPVSN